MERKITNFLISWKKDKDKLPLIIKGARQVGKTYIIKEFAKNNYRADRIVYINFEENPTLENVFSGARDFETIKNKLSINPKYKNVDFSDNNKNPFLYL